MTVAAAGTRAALEAVGIEVLLCDLDRRDQWSRASRATAAIIHANPDRLSRTVRDPALIRAAIGDRPAIGYWVWEAPGLPSFWRPWLPLVDAIWVPSHFVGQGLMREVALPVSVVPHPVSPPLPSLTRQQLGIPADRFLFLYVFNARSKFIRKNPGGLLKAYCQAFPRDDGTSILVLKTMGMRPEEAKRLEALAGDRRDILIADRHLTSIETSSLIAQCDCYVSLHRAEGFGLTVAEAMALERPVICTGYSGVLDFVAPDTAYLVDYTLGRSPRQFGVFPAGTEFAQPDGDQAAALMRHVFDMRDEARARGRRAAEAVRRKLSPTVVGERMRNLLEAKLGAGQRLPAA